MRAAHVPHVMPPMAKETSLGAEAVGRAGLAVSTIWPPRAPRPSV